MGYLATDSLFLGVFCWSSLQHITKLWHLERSKGQLGDSLFYRLDFLIEEIRDEIVSQFVNDGSDFLVSEKSLRCGDLAGRWDLLGEGLELLYLYVHCQVVVRVECLV